MQCPRCGSSHTRKNGKKQGKQNHVCCGCRRQFIDIYEPKGYPDEIKRECLEMYVNGMGFRAIERVKKVHHTTNGTEISMSQQLKPLRSRVLHTSSDLKSVPFHHTTVINWVKQVCNFLPSAPEYKEIPEVAELDELETFVGSKKTKFGCGQP